MSQGLAAGDLPSDLPAPVAEEILKAISEFQQPVVKHSKGLVLQNLGSTGGFVAIATKDLDLWKEVVGVMGGLAAVVPNLVSIAGGLVVLLFRLRREQVFLTGFQGALLLQLKKFGKDGCTENELFDALNISSELRAEATAALKFMRAASAQGGETKQLVVESEGRVRAGGV